MSAKFRAILRLAQKTFERGNEALFFNNFNILQEMVNEISCKDFGIINPDEYFHNAMHYANARRAPCSFMQIFENEDVSMSIFIMHGDFSMPLHDHPSMYGLVKVLYGKLRVQSYSLAMGDADNRPPYVHFNKKPVKVIREVPVTRSPTSECSILTPIQSNFHELTALQNVAAFFDILGPPYGTKLSKFGGQRNCTFYNVRPINGMTTTAATNKQHDSTTNTNTIANTNVKVDHDDIVLLEKATGPNNYYCDSIDVPKFLEDTIAHCEREFSAAKLHETRQHK